MWILDNGIKRSNIKEKIHRQQNAKGLIQGYIKLNTRKWINVQGLLKFIKPWNL